MTADEAILGKIVLTKFFSKFEKALNFNAFLMHLFTTYQQNFKCTYLFFLVLRSDFRFLGNYNTSIYPGSKK